MDLHGLRCACCKEPRLFWQAKDPEFTTIYHRTKEGKRLESPIYPIWKRVLRNLKTQKRNDHEAATNALQDPASRLICESCGEDWSMSPKESKWVAQALRASQNPQRLLEQIWPMVDPQERQWTQKWTNWPRATWKALPAPQEKTDPREARIPGPRTDRWFHCPECGNRRTAVRVMKTVLLNPAKAPRLPSQNRRFCSVGNLRWILTTLPEEFSIGWRRKGGQDYTVHLDNLTPNQPLGAILDLEKSKGVLQCTLCNARSRVPKVSATGEITEAPKYRERSLSQMRLDLLAAKNHGNPGLLLLQANDQSHYAKWRLKKIQEVGNRVRHQIQQIPRSPRSRDS